MQEEKKDTSFELETLIFDLMIKLWSEHVYQVVFVYVEGRKRQM